MEVVNKVVKLKPKEIKNIVDTCPKAIKLRTTINEFNRFDLEKPAINIVFDRVNFYKFGYEKMIETENEFGKKLKDHMEGKPSANENETALISVKEDSIRNILYSKEYTTKFCSINYEFHKFIGEREYSDKTIFKFWSAYVGFNGIFKRAMLKEYERCHSQMKMGMNRFVIVPTMKNMAVLDYYTISYSVYAFREKVSFHEYIVGVHLKKMKNAKSFKYTPYTHFIKPQILMGIANDSDCLEYNGGHTQLFIKPVGFYTFQDEKCPSNIEGIYFDTGGITHTKQDLIIYEIYDEIQNKQVIAERKKKWELSKVADKILESSPILKNKNKRKKNKDKKRKQLQDKMADLNNKELNELIHIMVESEPIYESDVEDAICINDDDEEEDEEEEEEEEEEEIIKPTPKPKPPPPKKIIKPLDIQPKLFFMKNVDNQNLISGMISQAIKKKSKFYNLVKDSSTIYITQGIHNSFHKTEKYNHFNIKLSQDHITFHIYIDEARILYFTKLTFEYD